MKVFVLEDQKYPAENLMAAVKSILPEFYAGEVEIDLVKSYNAAQIQIEAATGIYSFAFVDHKVPLDDVGDLEEKDMEEFSKLLEEVGYNLINLLREKNLGCVVIGTSSFNQSELDGFPKPDYTLGSKSSLDEAEESLKIVLKEELLKLDKMAVSYEKYGRKWHRCWFCGTTVLPERATEHKGKHLCTWCSMCLSGGLDVNLISPYKRYNIEGRRGETLISYPDNN